VFDGPAGKAEPEPHPSGVTGSRLIDAIEALEDGLAVFRRDPRTVVNDLDEGDSSPMFNDYANATTLGTVLDGVVEKVQESLPQDDGVDDGFRWRKHFNRQNLPLLISQGFELVDDVIDQCGKVDSFWTQRGSTGVRPTEEKERIDESPETVGFLPRAQNRKTLHLQELYSHGQNFWVVVDDENRLSRLRRWSDHVAPVSMTPRPACPPAGARPRHAQRPAGAQACRQLPAQRAARAAPSAARRSRQGRSPGRHRPE